MAVAWRCLLVLVARFRSLTEVANHSLQPHIRLLSAQNLDGGIFMRFMR